MADDNKAGRILQATSQGLFGLAGQAQDFEQEQKRVKAQQALLAEKKAEQGKQAKIDEQNRNIQKVKTGLSVINSFDKISPELFEASGPQLVGELNRLMGVEFDYRAIAKAKKGGDLGKLDRILSRSLTSTEPMEENELAESLAIMRALAPNNSKMRDQLIKAEQDKRRRIAQQEDAEDSRGESGLIKSIGTVQGKSVGAAFEARPQADQQIENLDVAFDVVDRVATGPLAGKEMAFVLQEVANEDAQALRFFLNREGIRQIMKFAKDAGARAIDTPEEQRRVLGAIASKEMDAPVFKKAIISMKAAALEGAIVTDEKKAWLAAGNTNLVGFKPSTQGKKAYVTPQGEILFLGKEEDKPKDALTLRQMWNKKGDFFTANPKAKERQIEGPTETDIDKMSKEELEEFLAE